MVSVSKATVNFETQETYEKTLSEAERLVDFFKASEWAGNMSNSEQRAFCLDELLFRNASTLLQSYQQRWWYCTTMLLTPTDHGNEATCLSKVSTNSRKQKVLKSLFVSGIED